MKNYIDFIDCPKCEKAVMPLREALLLIPITQNLSRPRVSCQSCRVTLEPSNVSLFSFVAAALGGLVAALYSMQSFPLSDDGPSAQSLVWAATMGGLTALALLGPGLLKRGFRRPLKNNR